MRTVAVIPVKGRLPLLKYTIRRLYRKNGVFKVICVGDTMDEKMTCQLEGAEFVQHDNNPLGRKWNAGFKAARRYEPDAVLFVGSSDWISDNWLPTLEPFIKNGVDLIGKPDFYLLDIGENDLLRFCHWQGYGKGPRKDEPIGIGRLISKRILDLMNWEPMDPKLNSSMDWSMYQKTLSLGGKVSLFKGGQIQSLSISTYQWPNMHKFNDHYSNKLPSNRMPNFGNWLQSKFPEHKLIFSHENKSVRSK